MTVARTPGPWRIGDAGATVFGPPNGKPAPEVVASHLKRANASFIVEACNEHDGLQNKVDALMAQVVRLREALANIGQPPSGKNRMTLAAAIGIARAALAGVGK